MVAVVEDGFDARGVGGEDRLRAGGEVDPVVSHVSGLLFDFDEKSSK